jgi:DNA-binding transcriptional ArsR family regulator
MIDMPREPRLSTPVPLPELPRLLAVLGDDSRLAIVRLLLDGELRTAGQIAEQVALPASTCSYHLSKLLNAGVTVCQYEGTFRYPVLRRAEFERRFPGMLDVIAAGAEQPA